MTIIHVPAQLAFKQFIASDVAPEWAAVSHNCAFPWRENRVVWFDGTVEFVRFVGLSWRRTTFRV